MNLFISIHGVAFILRGNVSIRSLSRILVSIRRSRMRDRLDEILKWGQVVINLESDGGNDGHYDLVDVLV